MKTTSRRPSTDSLERTTRTSRIVVVGEDAATRHLLSSALRRDGHDVVLASDAEQVFEYLGTLCLRHERPDLFISDTSVHGWTRLDVVTLLEDLGWKTPVIRVKDLGAPAERPRIRAPGAAAVIDKPIDLAELRAAVAGALGRAS